MTTRVTITNESQEHSVRLEFMDPKTKVIYPDHHNYTLAPGQFLDVHLYDTQGVRLTEVPHD
jgi:hypothetical protein